MCPQGNGKEVVGQDMAQYLDLFLQEGREQLEILERETLKLEQEPSDERMNVIFRAAHTLKGASRAMGFNALANLTHEMENVLDLLRSHQLQLTTEIADALLASVDNLVAMCDDVGEGGSGANAEDAELVARLQRCASGSVVSSPAVKISAQSDSSILASAPLPEGLEEGLTAAVEGGENVYHVRLRLSEDCILKFARAFMAMGVVSEGGELLCCIPDGEALEDENFERDFEFFFTHASSLEELTKGFGRLAEVELLSLESWLPSSVATSASLSASATVPTTDPASSEPASSLASQGEVAGGEAAAAIEASPEPKSEPKAAEASKPAKKADSGQTVRVDVNRLEELMNLVGELVIDRTRVGQLLSSLSRRYSTEPEIHALNEVVGHLNRVSSSLQEHLMKARMLPIETVFARLPRMVRDLAQKVGKQVNLELLGSETELDRSVIEVVGDPLIHILRNSLDHGIEMPEVRLERGKPVEGLVRVSARHEDSSLVIEISDDGGGISAARLKKKAVESGTLTQAAADQMTEKEALNLIFASGLSTAEKVSEISGRGVGMDIVRSNIQRLGGLVDVETEVGKGSTFRLRLPLTLAIIRGLLVRVTGNVYVLPLSSVVETLRIPKSEIRRRHKSEVIIVRGVTTPLIRLNQVFPLEGQKVRPTDDRNFVVIVGFADQRVGLMVDELIGEQEVVIKPLGKVCGQISGLSGATILGDGKVALICDLNSLLNGQKK